MKIVVVVMGQDCYEDLIPCLDSIKEADAIVYCDGGSKDESKVYAASRGAILIKNEYRQDDPEMNGKQRNFYLAHLKQHYDGWWCLCLDADEIVEDFDKLRGFLEAYENCSVEKHPTIFSVRMRHLIGDLRHEDATMPKHHVGNRLFKISPHLKYPLGEHVLLGSEEKVLYRNTECTTIWHTAYAKMGHLLKRYRKHLEHSNIHTPQFLREWYLAHLFGWFPKNSFDPVELPESLLRYHGVDRDELYFRNRGLELKHFVDAITWRDHFKCKTALLLGCGLGPRVYAFTQVGVLASGIEKSDWAVKHSLVPLVDQGDIVEGIKAAPHELVVAYDVLEHLTPADLEQAIDNIKQVCKRHLLVSVPVVGDPNLDADPTHHIKKPRSWWVRQFTNKGFKEQPVPHHFPFRHQLMIFEAETDGSS